MSPSVGVPSVGVVVPCKNEVATLRLCLESLRAQEPSIEHIVVVDNGSTDGSREIAADVADEVIDLPDASISEMRNTGAAHLGDVDVVGFVDADCEVAPGWLRAGLDAIDQSYDMVGARTLSAPNSTWVAARWALIEQQRAHSQSNLWSQHLLVKRATFDSLNGFDESVRTGEDADLSARLRANGGRLAMRPDMVVVHHGFPATLGRFIRREIWHSSTPGWYELMSPKSKVLVSMTVGWLAVGAAAAVTSVLSGRAKPVAGWVTGTVLAAPLVGWTAGRSIPNSAKDGVLLGIWSAIRAVRRSRELVGSGTARGAKVRATR